MSPRDDIAIWVDLECTGSGDNEEIVEFGAIITTLPGIDEISRFSTIVIPTQKAWDGMAPVVVDMHTKSGLFQDIVDGKGIPLGDLEREVLRWFDLVTEGDTTHVPLGGSGVSHYDRKYIRRDLPRFNRRLTFWAYDAGVLRRTFRMAGVPWLEGATDETKTHRALEDAQLHAAEFKHALDVLRQSPTAVPTLAHEPERATAAL